MNIGFSGDRTQHVLWRLENGEITFGDGHEPKLAVIMIGTNNSNGNDNTAEEIALGIEAIVASLRAKLPDTKILLLAIFPRGEAKPSDNPQRDKNAKASARASKLADGKMVHYLDIGPKLTNADGTISPDVMPDYLHLSPQGYQQWADAIEDKVKELMGETPAGQPKPAAP
jgi:lysophospholipase L1-like esterase